MQSFRKLLLGLLVCAGLLYQAPLLAKSLPQFHERLTWSGPDRAQFTLEYWAQSRQEKGHDIPTECVLRTRLIRVLGGHSRVRQGQNVFTDPMWAQVDCAVAIRVTGDEAPQILVRRSRANWGDYLLYRMDEHGLKETFSFSYRDEGCIRWVSHQGSLQQFIAIDRFETRNRPEEPPGKRWQQRLVYRYNRTKKTWTPSSTHWETYVFDDQNSALNNPVFHKPRDCPFRFARTPRITALQRPVK